MQLKLAADVVNLNRDAGGPGANPDGGGDLSAGLDCRGEQTADRGPLSRAGLDCSAHMGWAGIGKDGFVYSAISTAESKVSSGLQPEGRRQLALCCAGETQQVKLRTRLGTRRRIIRGRLPAWMKPILTRRIIPERDPQKGQ